MIVLDASVLVAYLDLDDAHHAASIDILTRTEPFAVHPLTLAEILVRPAREGQVGRALEKLHNLGVSELGYLNAESRRLAEIRVRTGLKLPDCCVVVAAESQSASLATFDPRLASAAQERGLEVVAVP